MIKILLFYIHMLSFELKGFLTLAAVFFKLLKNENLISRNMKASGFFMNLIIGSTFILTSLYTSAATYTVTAATDANAFGGGQTFGALQGDLRWCMIQANSGVGNTVAFNIPGVGVRTIILSTAPPVITQNVHIDGNTQPGWTSATGPLIEVGGPGFGNGFFVNGANGFIIQHLTINRFQDPIRLTNCLNSVVRGCWIGVNNTATGTQGVFGNNAGVYITGGSFNTIGGNLVSNPEYKNVIANCKGGVEIESSVDNIIKGCYFSVDKTGNVVIQNQFEAIVVRNLSHRTIIGGNNPGDGNIMGSQVGANNQCVIFISGSDDCTICGNRIGLSASGTTVFSIPVGGIYLNGASNCSLGGTSTSGRNVIVTSSGSGGYHAISFKSGSNSNVLYNNYISTDHNGNNIAAAVKWGGYGILFQNSTNNIVGGIGAGQRNIICHTTNSGVAIEMGSINTSVIGNYIGVTANNIAKGCGNPGGNDGVQVNGVTGTVINNNVISNSGDNGIDITLASGGTIIKGNFIGTDINGMTCMSNTLHGIEINGSNGHVIGGSTPGERNVISGNGGSGNYSAGIYLTNVSNSSIKGNYIGTDVTGNAVLTGCGWAMPSSSSDCASPGTSGVARGNEVNGVYINGTSSNNVVGGTGAGEGNVFGGNGYGKEGWYQALQFDGASGNFAYGNYVGIGADGVTPVPNSSGISSRNANNNVIGGATSAHRNIISSNSVWGILVQGGSNISTIGNYIGTDVSGSLDRGNGLSGWRSNCEGGGVGYINGANNSFIGNNAVGEGNLIANNKVGIALFDGGSGGSSNIKIYNNDIYNSKNSTGLKIPTLYGNGIALLSGSTLNNFIGGSSLLMPNRIYNNYKNGIFINGGSVKNWISQNSIYCNGNTFAVSASENKGINLNSGGGNSGYPAPVVFSNVAPAPPNSDANTLRGTAPANSNVEIFSTEPCVTCPPLGGVQTEGITYRATVVANGSGSWSWTPVGGLIGQYTATATEPSGTNRNTSEFSTCGYITLPVNLISFKASYSNSVVNLFWQTVSEKMNDHFIIEKSSDGGTTFTEIGNVSGKGTYSGISDYYFADTEISLSQTVYYRLIQVDIDGKSVTSQSIMVDIDREDHLFISPNPINSNFTIRINDETLTDYEITIFDAIGKNVNYSTNSISEDLKTLSISIENLPAGLYYLLYTSPNLYSMEKIIKE